MKGGIKGSKSIFFYLLYRYVTVRLRTCFDHYV